MASHDAHNNLFYYVLSVAGPIFFMSMQLSYLQTASKIISKRSDCQLSPLPFVSLVTNCAVMSLYAFLRSNATIFVPNFSGFLTGIVCTCAFQTYTTDVKKEIFLIAGCILVLAAYLTAVGAAYPLGLVGVCLSVILMGSPLATLATVIREKSTNSLPFSTSVATFFNALSWSLYGVLEANDAIVYVPNLIGLFLACIQLSLFVVYGMPSEVVEQPKYSAINLTKPPEVANLKLPLVNNDKKAPTNYV
jgi:solute carrier family 50 (sugar transporter)